MLQSEYYLGLPNEIWNNLLIEAEDILSEEEIGIHIMGVYPSGSRIYGKESSSPEFICLHMDSPETILNPSIIHTPDNDTGYWEKTIKLDGSKVTFIHLFDWIQWIIYKENKYSMKLMNMHDIIPCNQDIAYQDNSLSDLMLLVREYITINRTICSRNFVKDKTSYEEKLQYCLYMRTQYLLKKTDVFSPNLNPSWGNVVSLEQPKGSDLYEIDKFITETVLKNNRRVSEIDLDVYSWKLWKKEHEVSNSGPFFYTNKKANISPKIKELADEISKETMKIYRYIL